LTSFAIGVMVKLLKEKSAGRVIVGDMSGIEHVKLSAGRILNQAYRVFGGRPRLTLDTANELVPVSLSKRLSGMVTPLIST
jgi:hypothetical protein